MTTPSASAPIPKRDQPQISSHRTEKSANDIQIMQAALASIPTEIKGSTPNGHDARLSLPLSLRNMEMATESVTTAKQQWTSATPPKIATHRAAILAVRTRSTPASGGPKLAEARAVANAEKAFWASLPATGRRKFIDAQKDFEKRQADQPATAKRHSADLTTTQATTAAPQKARAASLPPTPVAAKPSTASATPKLLDAKAANQLSDTTKKLMSGYHELKANYQKAATASASDSRADPKKSEQLQRTKNELEGKLVAAEEALEKRKNELTGALSADAGSQRKIGSALNELRKLTDEGELAEKKLGAVAMNRDNVVRLRLEIPDMEQGLADMKDQFAKRYPNPSDKEKSDFEKKYNFKAQSLPRKKQELAACEAELKKGKQNIENMIPGTKTLAVLHSKLSKDYDKLMRGSDPFAAAKELSDENKTIDAMRSGQEAANTRAFANRIPYGDKCVTTTWENANKVLEKRDPANAAKYQAFTKQITNVGHIYSDAAPKLSKFYGETKGPDQGLFLLEGDSLRTKAGSATEHKSTLEHISKMKSELQASRETLNRDFPVRKEVPKGGDILAVAEGGRQYFLQAIQSGLDRLTELEAALTALQ